MAIKYTAKNIRKAVKRYDHGVILACLREHYADGMDYVAAFQGDDKQKNRSRDVLCMISEAIVEAGIESHADYAIDFLKLLASSAKDMDVANLPAAPVEKNMIDLALEHGAYDLARGIKDLAGYSAPLLHMIDMQMAFDEGDEEVMACIEGYEEDVHLDDKTSEAYRKYDDVVYEAVQLCALDKSRESIALAEKIMQRHGLSVESLDCLLHHTKGTNNKLIPLLRSYRERGNSSGQNPEPQP